MPSPAVTDTLAFDSEQPLGVPVSCRHTILADPLPVSTDLFATPANLRELPLRVVTAPIVAAMMVVQQYSDWIAFLTNNAQPLRVAYCATSVWRRYQPDS
ncbi:MAG: hypothetical protein K0U93_11075 [Gammaproteobacteria bacterium]|nr:hypothetical protein [Gammaproteobacteria bacterium]